MDTVITFTPSQFVAGVLLLCTLVTAIAGLTGVITSAFGKMKAPEKVQNERLTAVEKDISELKKLVKNNHEDRLKTIEEGQKITLRALLALLSHGLDGNDVDAMRSVKAELQTFLIDK